MSEACPPVRKPVRPSPVRRASTSRRPGGISGADFAVILAGIVLALGIGYVAYRTQVLGEPVERVLPFLGESKKASDTPASSGSSTEATPDMTGGETPAASPSSAPVRPNPQPVDTVFGRREGR